MFNNNLNQNIENSQKHFLQFPKAVYLTQYIIFDTHIPVQITDSFDLASQILQERLNFKKNNSYRYDCLALHLITSVKNTGECILHEKYTYDHMLNILVREESSYDNIHPTPKELIQEKLHKLPSVSIIQPYVQSQIQSQIQAKNTMYPHVNTPNLNVNYKPITTKQTDKIELNPMMYNVAQTTSNIQTQNIQTQNIQTQKEKSSDDLKSELLKLTQILSKVSENTVENKVIDSLEKVYSDIAEEAELDAEINASKDKLDKICEEKKVKYKGVYNSVYDVLDETAFSEDSDEKDSDDNDSDNNDSDDNESSNDDSDTSDDEQIHTSDENPPELNQLIEARNFIKKQIKKEELVVQKANEKLSEDYFVKRCEDQAKRKAQEKYDERLSIFAANKNTFLVMQSKVKQETLREHNIANFFMQKYHIIKFMNSERLISLRSNENIKEEEHIFNQLTKILEAYEIENNSESENSESENSDSDPMSEIEEKYLPLCEKFLDIIQQLDYDIISEKVVHKILNENPQLKEALFKETADQTVFITDTSEEVYAEEEKQEQANNENKGNFSR